MPALGQRLVTTPSSLSPARGLARPGCKAGPGLYPEWQAEKEGRLPGVRRPAQGR